MSEWDDWEDEGRWSSATTKLTRANELLDDIDAEIGSFFKMDPYLMASEVNAETGERIRRVVEIDEPPIRLSVLIGDALHNLRSALDHLVWERSAPEKRDGKTGFPLLIKPPRGAFLDYPRVRGLSVSDRAIVERLQPYQARDPNEVLAQPLRVIHDLNIADKHKFLHLTGLAMENAVLIVSAPGAMIRHRETFPGTFKDGAILARVVVAPPEAEVEMYFDPTFEVAFEPGTTPWHDLPVGQTLAILSATVEDAIRRFPWERDF